MPRANRERGIRKNVVLTPAAAQRLQFIKTAADLPTDADAIRSTLRTFEKLLRAQLDGATVKIVYADKSFETLEKLYEPFIGQAALDALKEEVGLEPTY